MSHVDDGELTAYADGAYPANDPEALRIAAHLSTCGNCRTRLEQSHELRDRAAEILAFAAPASVAPPSFETLQAQAATPMRTRRRTFPLAWAASIMLAVGLGWFGRGIWQAPRPSGMMVRMDAPQVSTEVKEEGISTEPAPSAEQASRPTSQSARTEDRTRDMAANRAEKQVAGAGVAANTGAAPPPSAAPMPAAPPPTPPQAAVSEFRQRTELAEVVVSGEATQYITAAEAERRGIQLARVPELPITRVGLRSGTTIIEQVLPDEKVVTLTVTNAVAAEALALAAQDAAGKRREVAPAAAAPPAAAQASAAALARTVVVRVGERSVTITGNLPPDSLRALGRKIR
jgi:hypothetical protein